MSDAFTDKRLTGLFNYIRPNNAFSLLTFFSDISILLLRMNEICIFSSSSIDIFHET